MMVSLASRFSTASPEVAPCSVVVYRNPFLRDLILQVLADAGIDVSAAIKGEDLSGPVLEVLRPDVIVADQDAEELVNRTIQASARQGSRASSRIITLDLATATLFVRSTSQVLTASVENLVGAVFAGMSETLRPDAAARPRETVFRAEVTVA